MKFKFLILVLSVSLMGLLNGCKSSSTDETTPANAVSNPGKLPTDPAQAEAAAKAKKMADDQNRMSGQHSNK